VFPELKTEFWSAVWAWAGFSPPRARDYSSCLANFSQVALWVIAAPMGDGKWPEAWGTGRQRKVPGCPWLPSTCMGSPPNWKYRNLFLPIREVSFKHPGANSDAGGLWTLGSVILRLGIFSAHHTAACEQGWLCVSSLFALKFTSVIEMLVILS
jgi:hypothetical protein